MATDSASPPVGKVVFSPLEERVHANVRRMVFDNARVGILAGFLALGGLSLIDWGLSPEMTNAWCLVMFFCLIGRLAAVILQWWQSEIPPEAHSEVPYRIYYVASVTEGVMWGSSMFFLWPSDPYSQAFLLIVLVGIAVGAMAVFSGSMSLYAIYATSIIALTFLKLISLNVHAFNVLGALTWVLLMALLVVAYRMNTLFLGMMRLSFKNEQLAAIEAASKHSIVDFSKKLSAKTTEVEHVTQRLQHVLKVLAHDMRTQLVTIFRFAQYLADEKGSLYDGPFIVQTLKQASASSMRLIDEMIGTAGVEIGKPSLELLSGSINTIVEKSINRVKSEAERRGVILYTAVDESRPVNMNVQQIEEVLSCLIERAVSRSQRDGAVTVQTTPTVRGLRVEVIDSGEQERMDINEDPDEKQHDMSGLALLQQIVKAHDSQIEVENTPKVGRCYSFTLPWATP